MSARGIFAIVLVVLLAIGAAAVALFWVQNGPRVTDLSLNLGVAAFHLSNPVSVPVLMACCFGAGFLGGVAVLAIPLARASSRARRGASTSDVPSWR